VARGSVFINYLSYDHEIIELPDELGISLRIIGDLAAGVEQLLNIKKVLR
jgi:hypothetical protein